jgi:hypothetical protein
MCWLGLEEASKLGVTAGAMDVLGGW